MGGSSAFIGGQICFSSETRKNKTKYRPPMNADESKQHEADEGSVPTAAHAPQLLRRIPLAGAAVS